MASEITLPPPKITKFRVSEKDPESYKEKTSKVGEKNEKHHLITALKLYEKNHCTEVLQATEFPPTTVSCHVNGFVNTVVECYNNHYNLVIRPDDIWTAIMTQFSFYLNANAEKYRKQFVNFEGKKELVVVIPGTLRSAPYDLFVAKMTEKIDENLVDKEVRSWVLPNFSTTTKQDWISCGAIFMAAMKKYFDFTCCLACGIPWVTLEGTLQDWEDILGRLEKLKSYEMEKWHGLLEPILKQFVETKKGNIDVDFWSKICHRSGGGSGPRYLSGWMSTFCAYNIDGNWQATDRRWTDRDGDEKPFWPYVDISKIPSGVVEADVKIIDLDESIYYSVLLAGHMAVDVIEDETTKCTLKPQIGWALALKPSPEEIEELEKDNPTSKRRRLLQ